jgi:histidine phosphotransferase ChpT
MIIFSAAVSASVTGDESAFEDTSKPASYICMIVEPAACAACIRPVSKSDGWFSVIMLIRPDNSGFGGSRPKLSNGSSGFVESEQGVDWRWPHRLGIGVSATLDSAKFRVREPIGNEGLVMKFDAVLSDMDLSALLCSKVCHDVISPVGAIANGLEVLEDEKDAEMRDIAFDLVKRSSRQASAKLQFCRIAFGAAGSAGSSIDTGDAEDVARKFIGEDKIELEWAIPREIRPKSEVKLMLNMLMLAISSIPRGGKIVMGVADGGGITATATGKNAKVPEKTSVMLSGDVQEEAMDARLAQVYYTLRLASECSLELAAAAAEDSVIYTASAA